MDKPAHSEWTAHGLLCRIYEGAFKGIYNGYVRLPEWLREKTPEYHDPIFNDIEINGGLTYGIDAEGFVGFDTLHSWDAWEDAEWEHSRELARSSAPHTLWTIDRLRGEVERLAEQLAALDKGKL